MPKRTSMDTINKTNPQTTKPPTNGVPSEPARNNKSFLSGLLKPFRKTSTKKVNSFAGNLLTQKVIENERMPTRISSEVNRTEVSVRFSSSVLPSRSMNVWQHISAFNTNPGDMIKTDRRREISAFMTQVSISTETISTILAKGLYDAVAVDLEYGKPVSAPAEYLFREIMNSPTSYQEHFNCDSERIVTRTGKPSVVMVNRIYEDGPWPLDRRTRNGVGCALRAVARSANIQKMVLYPLFCRNSSEWNNQNLCHAHLWKMVSHMMEMYSRDTLQILVAGMTAENIEALKMSYDQYLSQNMTLNLEES